MREFTIGKNDAGQRLDRFVARNLPLLPPALLQKYIRLKRIKVNGKGSKRDTRLCVGDILQLYINDEFFDKPTEENLFLSVFRPQLNLVYEDENLLLVDKRPGMVVHADETEKVNTLINHIQAYLYQKKEWNPKWENAFAPALCNRIDRNTGGIVIAAIKNHELEKSYLCVTVGRPRPAEGRVEGFLRKDEAKKEVTFFDHPIPGGKTAVTLYRTLESRGELSMVECRLLTEHEEIPEEEELPGDTLEAGEDGETAQEAPVQDASEEVSGALSKLKEFKISNLFKKKSD